MTIGARERRASGSFSRARKQTGVIACAHSAFVTHGITVGPHTSQIRVLIWIGKAVNYNAAGVVIHAANEAIDLPSLTCSMPAHFVWMVLSTWRASPLTIPCREAPVGKTFMRSPLLPKAGMVAVADNHQNGTLICPICMSSMSFGFVVALRERLEEKDRRRMDCNRILLRRRTPLPIALLPPAVHACAVRAAAAKRSE